MPAARLDRQSRSLSLAGHLVVEGCARGGFVLGVEYRILHPSGKLFGRHAEDAGCIGNARTIQQRFNRFALSGAHVVPVKAGVPAAGTSENAAFLPRSWCPAHRRPSRRSGSAGRSPAPSAGPSRRRFWSCRIAGLPSWPSLPRVHADSCAPTSSSPIPNASASAVRRSSSSARTSCDPGKSSINQTKSNSVSER
jgi:hypothetical protein